MVWNRPNTTPSRPRTTTRTTTGTTQIFALYAEPILHPTYQTYETILTVDAVPPGGLSERVARMHVSRLSEFAQNSAGYGKCIYAVVDETTRQTMGLRDLPTLLTYLVQNGYVFETDLTQMTKTLPEEDSRKRIAFLSYTDTES